MNPYSPPEGVTDVPRKSIWCPLSIAIAVCSALAVFAMPVVPHVIGLAPYRHISFLGTKLPLYDHWSQDGALVFCVVAALLCTWAEVLNRVPKESCSDATD